MAEVISMAALPGKVANITKQLRFAGVITLTRTAFIVRGDVMAEIRKVFTLRNTFTEKGVRVDGAKKEQREPFADIFTTDWFLADHETGDRRKAPGSGEGVFEIPVAFFKQAGVDPKRRISKGKRASTIIAKAKAGERTPRIGGQRPFLATFKNKTGIWVREGSDRLPIRLLYRLTDDDIKIDKMPFFFDTVNDSIDRNLDKQHARAVREAFASAR